jgi:hypothetical protein
VPELLSEELRRLDPDDVYAATVQRLHKMSTAPAKKSPAKTGSTSGSKRGRG